MSKRQKTTAKKPHVSASASSDVVPLLSRPWMVGLLLLTAVLLAYLPLVHAGFIWDDDDYVTENPALLNLAGLKSIWCDASATPQYYPLVFTTFWLEQHLWGLQPLGYHVVNVVLHALGAFLLWRVLERLRMPGAKLAAFFFALHPVAVESVAWVTERKNVLSGVLYFAAALVYLRFRPFEENSRQETRPGRWRWYAVAALFFTGALLSKSVTASLPAALLLVGWWKRNIRWRDVLLLLPFFALGLGLGLNTMWLEKHHVGAQGQDWALSFVQRCLIAARVPWFYAAKLAWPANLTFIYLRWDVAANAWWQWLFPVATVATVAFLWCQRGRWGRGPLVAVLFFVGTLFPVWGFVNFYPMRFSFVADHFQYLASVGLIVLAAAGLSRFAPTKIIWGLPVVLGLLTWQQAHVYRDAETVWRDTIQKNPACWLAHNDLGIILKEGGDIAGAEAEYRTALKWKPDYTEALNNWGETSYLEGKLDQALQFYRAALKCDPNCPPALNGLGGVLLAQGRNDEAWDCFQRALQLKPNDPDTLSNFGVALGAKKQFPESAAAFETALRLKPNQPQARINYGNMLIDAGKLDEAAQQFQAALQLNPGDARAHVDLARVFSLQSETSEALQQYGEAMRLGLRDANVSYNYATLLGAAGRLDDSSEQFELSLQLKPDNAEAHNNLGVNFIRKGSFMEAALQIKQALQLKPDYAEAHNNMAYLLIQAGQTEQARKHLLEALRISPGFVQARRQLNALDAAHSATPAPSPATAP